MPRQPPVRRTASEKGSEAAASTPPTASSTGWAGWDQSLMMSQSSSPLEHLQGGWLHVACSEVVLAPMSAIR